MKLNLKSNGIYQYKNKKFRQFIDQNHKVYIEKTTDIINYNLLRQIADVAKTTENLHGIVAFYKHEADEQKFKYLVELKKVKTIEELIEEKIQLNQAEIDSIIYQVASGLSALHKENILHRDVKPANIIIDEHNLVQLIDYDISRVYDENKHQDTTHSGTKGFVAPELYMMKQTDIRSDIYSLGKTLEILINECGYEYRYEYNELITKATAVDINNRYHSTDAIIEIIKKKKNRFFPPQLEQIAKAKVLGLSEEEISVFAKTIYNAKQMGVLKHAINEKVDAEVLQLITDPEFTSQQMWQIKTAAQEGLSFRKIIKFAKPYYTVSEMTIYRLGLGCNKSEREITSDIRGYNQIIAHQVFSDEQLKKIRQGFYQGLTLEQIKVYAHDFLNVKQMEQIIEILKSEGKCKD